MFIILDRDDFNLRHTDERKHRSQVWIEVIQRFVASTGTVTSVASRDHRDQTFPVDQWRVRGIVAIGVKIERSADANDLIDIGLEPARHAEVIECEPEASIGASTHNR